MTRGRKPQCPEFSEANRLAGASIRFDSVDDYDEIHRRIGAWEPVRGITRCPKAALHEDRWYVKFSIGGKQWTLGAFQLLEASKIYDACFVRFKSWRRRQPDELLEKSWLNWSRSEAEDNIANNAPLADFLNALERLWRAGGYLVSGESLTTAKQERARAYERRRSTAGMVETWGGDLRTILFEMQDKLDTLEKKLDKVLEAVEVLPTDKPAGEE